LFFFVLTDFIFAIFIRVKTNLRGTDTARKSLKVTDKHFFYKYIGL